MAKKNKKQELKREIIGITLIGFSLLYILSLFTYSAMDPPTSTLNESINNFVGIIGAYLSYVSLFLFGNIALMIPIVLIYVAVLLILNKINYNFRKIISFIILIFSTSIILHFNEIFLHPKFKWGGVIVNFLADKMQLLFGNVGSYIILILLMIISIISIVNVLFKNIFQKIYKILKRIIAGLFLNLISFIKKIFKSKKENKKSKKASSQKNSITNQRKKKKSKKLKK